MHTWEIYLCILMSNEHCCNDFYFIFATFTTFKFLKLFYFKGHTNSVSPGPCAMRGRPYFRLHLNLS